MKKSAWLIAGLAVSAVALAKVYAPPAGAPKANLLVKNLTTGVIEPATFENARKCTGRRTLAPGDMLFKSAVVPAGRELSIPIEAGKEFTLFVQFSLGASECRHIQAFTPEVGARYVATAFTEPGKCAVSLQREVATPDGRVDHVLQESRLREIPEITWGAGAQCREEAPRQ